MSDLQKGDKVRVAYEGVVDAALKGGPGTWNVRVTLPDGVQTYVRHEHVTAIEPEYEQGEVYVDAVGTKYYRMSLGRWRGVATATTYAHRTPIRPLRKLVPENAAPE